MKMFKLVEIHQFLLHTLLGVFTRQKCRGKVPRFQETIKSHWSRLPASLIKRQKESPLKLMHCWVGWIEPMLILGGLWNSPNKTWADRWSTDYTLCINFSQVQVLSRPVLLSPLILGWVLFNTSWYLWCLLRQPCFLGLTMLRPQPFPGLSYRVSGQSRADLWFQVL